MTALKRLAAGHWRTALGAVLGAAAGAAYARFIGCRSGTCALTSDARTAAVFFGIVGALVGWPSKRPAAERSRPPGAPGAP